MSSTEKTTPDAEAALAPGLRAERQSLNQGGGSLPARISDERRQRMVEMRSSGASYRVIGREFGVSPQRARQIVGRQTPARPRGRPPKSTPAQVMDMAIAVRNGESLRSVGKRFGYSAMGVSIAVARVANHLGSGPANTGIIEEALSKLLSVRESVAETISNKEAEIAEIRKDLDRIDRAMQELRKGLQ